MLTMLDDPFNEEVEAAAAASATAARIIVLTACLGLVSILAFAGRTRLKRLAATHVERRRLRGIAHELDAGRRKKGKEVGGGPGEVVVSGLFVHPVKSLRPVPIQSSSLTHLGLAGDRTLMLVRPRPPPSSSSLTASTSTDNPTTHRFVTQRQCPQLARIAASIPVEVDGRTVVRLSCDLIPTIDDDDDMDNEDGDEGEGEEAVHIDVTPATVANYPLRYTAGLWDDAVQVSDVGDTATLFVRRAIRAGIDADKAAGIKLETDDEFQDVRLVALLPGTSRPLPEAYLPPAARTFTGGVPHTSLNDGFPILVVNEASLEELNRRLVKRGKETLPMSRFRPNVIIRGAGPFEEDSWKAIRIRSSRRQDGNDEDKEVYRETILHLVKGCPRCKQSCTDQTSGRRHDAEPLETLATFRAVNPRCKEEVYFGQNAVPQVSGLGKGGGAALEVRVGDVVEVLTRGDPVWDKEDVQAE